MLADKLESWAKAYIAEDEIKGEIKGKKLVDKKAKLLLYKSY